MKEKKLLYVSLGICLLALSSCHSTATKELNESSARDLIKTAAETRPYVTPSDSVTSLFPKSRTDYKTFSGTGDGTFVRQLLEHGYVNQQVESISYPKIAGDFVAEEHNPCSGSNNPNGGSTREEYSIEMDPDSNSFHGTADYEVCGNDSRDSLKEGTVSPDGSMSAFAGIYRVSGTYSEQGSTASIDLQKTMWTKNWHMVGEATGQKVQLNWYTYALSPQGDNYFVQSGPDGKGFRAGTINIGEVSNLRLVGDTDAVAKFAWDVSLNDVGKILRSTAPKGTGEAEFAKKPDGTWFLTQWTTR